VLKVERVLLITAIFCGLAGSAKADTAFGVPVVANGSSTPSVPNCPALEGQSCYNPVTGAITFFIPLSSANGGVFGVTPHSGGTAGTFADTGSGASSSLTMYLMFSPVAVPTASASLTFAFVDLDLSGVNDPNGFFENVQFFSVNGTPLTPLITTNGESGGGGGTPTYFVSGNSTSQTIFFPDITSIVQNPFFVSLNFGSSYTSTGTNTPESLTGTLVSTPVPEPATILLMASGLLGLGLLRHRRTQTTGDRLGPKTAA
jgi:hypothetical protein